MPLVLLLLEKKNIPDIKRKKTKEIESIYKDKKISIDQKKKKVLKLTESNCWCSFVFSMT